MTWTTPSRRRVLTALGAATATALAGCTTGAGIGGEPTFEDGTVDDVDGEDRSAEELTAAESVAEREVNEGVSSLDALTVADHAFVLEDDYRGPTVQGTVENAADDRIDLVEVRVRVFDDDGDRLGRYLDTTGDLDADTDWSFEVILLESPDDVADYDIAVLGTPT